MTATGLAVVLLAGGLASSSWAGQDQSALRFVETKPAALASQDTFVVEIGLKQDRAFSRRRDSHRQVKQGQLKSDAFGSQKTIGSRVDTLWDTRGKFEPLRGIAEAKIVSVVSAEKISADEAGTMTSDSGETNAGAGLTTSKNKGSVSANRVGDGRIVESELAERSANEAVRDQGIAVAQAVSGEGPDTGQTQSVEVQTSSSEVEKQYQELQPAYSDLQREIDARDEAVASAQAKLAQLNAQLKQTQIRRGELVASLNKARQSNALAIQEIEMKDAEVAELKERIAELETRLSDELSRFNQLEKNLGAVLERFGEKLKEAEKKADEEKEARLKAERMLKELRKRLKKRRSSAISKQDGSQSGDKTKRRKTSRSQKTSRKRASKRASKRSVPSSASSKRATSAQQSKAVLTGGL